MWPVLSLVITQMSLLSVSHFSQTSASNFSPNPCIFQTIPSILFFQKYLTSTPYYIFNLVVFYYTFIYLVYGCLWADSKHQEGRSPWWFY